jgi:hypothetical protein
MFDTMDDAGVVDAVGACAREENAACARRLAAIGELYARRAPEDDDERRTWAIDGFENVVAEIAAAERISRGRAAGQLRYAIALRDRLPNVAEVFATGVIDFRMMAAIVTRVQNVEDPAVMVRLDAALAARVPGWSRLSQPKLIERIDAFVVRFDPAGVRVPPKPVDDRYVDIAPTGAGMAGVWAQIPAPDAAALDQRLDEVAATVCPADPRTKGQRRADALCALTTSGQDRLACDCGAPDCPAADVAKPPGEVVIHLLVEQATVDGAGPAPGYLPGFGPLPAPQVRDLCKTATIKPLPKPSPIPESGYRPSAALAEFVRWRDLTCRFPGCDRPAQVCDIDHTIAFPRGPTHPSNLKLLCRTHHLLKTFYTGKGGWADQQLPDGTVIWTAPSGHAYMTRPGGALFFPMLAEPTGELVIPTHTGPLAPARTLMMPRRKRTRALDRHYRISRERRINEARIAEERRQHEGWLAATYEPPPF